MKSKKIIILVSTALVAILAITYFFATRSSNLPKYIPNTAIGVVKINPLSIGRKIDFDAIKNMKSYKPMMKEMEKESKKFSKFIENPREIGMSLTDNIYFFGENLSSERNKAAGMVFGVSDANSLKTFIENFAKDANLEYEKSGDLNIFSPKKSDSDDEYSSSSNFAIVWNNDACLFYYAGKFSVKGAKQIMSQTKENSMLALDAFNESENHGGDMSLFINYKEYTKVIEKYSGMQITKSFPENIKKYYENVSAADIIVNFNDNDINSEFHQYSIDSKLAKDYKFLSEKGLSNENLELISPNGKVLMGFGAMLNMETIVNLLKSIPQYKTSIKEICTATGLTETEIETLLDGSLSFAVTKLNTKQVEEMVYDYENFNPETGEFNSTMQTVTKVVPLMTAQFGFQNEKTWTKILKQIETKSNGMIKPQNNILTIPAGVLGSVHMVFVKNKLVLTNDEESAQTLAKNKTWNNQLDKEINQLFSNNSAAYFIDMNLKNYGEGTLKQWLKIPEQSEEFETVKSVMSEFNNMQMSGDNTAATMSVNFTSGKENSLMRLFKIVDLISNQQLKKQAQSEAARKALEFQLQNEPQTVDTVSASTTYSDEAY
jgi:hypothetical protein